ncbi:MAG TPA: DNA recombination protein RmuC [Terriglobales bacterium]|nr:DNA recombination protein RmuC [Terriglobales bacterium]
MLFSELLFALLLVCLVAGMSVVAFTVASINRRAEAQRAELAELRGQLAAGGQVQESASSDLRERLSQTQTLLEGMRAVFVARHQAEEDARQSLRRLEAVLAGSPARGAAGENILEEAFRHLPPDMVRRNVWVNGKVVEFGLHLPGGKLLPIDSKWTSSAALQELAAPDALPARRAQLATAVEKEVERRVREVSQYIDPTTTAPFALAAVPDAAYAVCRSAFAEAHRRHVMIVAYSLTLPYLLMLYQLHLQFARSVDMEHLQACLMEVDRQLDVLDAALENRLQRAVTMLGNTYQDGKQVTARIRAAVRGIQASGRIEDSGGQAAAADEPLLSLRQG